MSKKILHIEVEDNKVTKVHTNFSADDCEKSVFIIAELKRRIESGQWQAMAIGQGPKKPVPNESDNSPSQEFKQVWYI